MKTVPRINSIYINPRLAARLDEAELCQITTIVAPMGYGKSTAVRWWVDKLTAAYPDAIILRQTLTGDGEDAFWRGFCRTLRRFPELSAQMTALGYPVDHESRLLLAELLEDALEGEDFPFFYIMDDVHLFTSPDFSELLLILAHRLPDRFRLILISRNRIFKVADQFQFGSSLCQITMDELRLRREEISEYARLCGISIEQDNARELDNISEGWISLLYLLFRSYLQNGWWQFNASDIFQLMDEVMYQPLDDRKRRFLLVNGLSDTFTREQAAYMWQEPGSEELLDNLTQENAFISMDPKSGTYRYHNMLRDVVKTHFSALAKDEQREMLIRLGQRQAEQKDYIQASQTFYAAGEWERLLDVLVMDYTNSFGAEQGPLIEKWSAECPEELLLLRPDALLILMLNLYTYNNIPEMMRLYELFQQSLEQNDTLDEQDRNNLLGDAEIALSFLEFNDISAMSAHHRRAGELMNRRSCSVSNKSPWTFGCPSILMTYHRTAGALDHENEEMKECMPYYGRVTGGHGAGADYVMAGETFLMRGQIAEAEIAYHQAVSIAAPRNQYSILITAAFLSTRQAILSGYSAGVTIPLERLTDLLMDNRQYILMPAADICKGWMCAMLGHPEDAPTWLLREDADASVFAVAAPMLHVFANQLLVARGDYSRVADRWEELHEMCGQFHYLLCDIYLKLQTAAAMFHLGNTEKGEEFLNSALEAALPDKIYLPFAEVDDCLVRHLVQRKDFTSPEAKELIQLAERYRQNRDRVYASLHGKEPADKTTSIQKDYGLSQREMEIAQMAAERKSNKEIADTLFLSERTVKNHLNRVYDKLNIPATERNKRACLEKILEEAAGS